MHSSTPNPTPRTDSYIAFPLSKQGDQVQVKDGDLFVNGVKIEEPYRNEPAQYSWGPRTVPEGMVLVLGNHICFLV